MLGQALGMMLDLGPTMSKLARGTYREPTHGGLKREKRRAEKKRKKLRRKQGRH